MELSTHFHKTVAVLFGGRSSEHEISLRSAVYILKNIPEKYNIIPVGISREGVFKSLTGVFCKHDFQNITPEHLAQIVDGQVPSQFIHSKNVESLYVPLRQESLILSAQNAFWRILNMEAFCAFPVLHGANGEDGRMQGLFELAEIAYVGCDIRSSVVGIDKDIQKRLARDAGISIAKYEVVEQEELAHNENVVCTRVEASLSYPCFVKPNSSGSAVGTNKVKNRAELLQALKEATAFDQKALVEEWLVGTEIECAFLGNSMNFRVTKAGEIVPQEFYSYEEKYGAQSKAELYIPAKLSSAKMQEVQSLAVKIVKIMGMSGLSRIDFWKISQTEQFVFNEYNTIPGLTSISMFPKLLEQEGVGSAIWIEELIEGAKNRKKILDKVQFGIKAAV